jgi:hypothetical protein
MTGTITSSAKLEIQSNYTGVITPNHPNMEKQIKVAVFLTEIENNKIISSTFLNEGWIRKPHTNADLNLLAVKEFNLSLDNLDKIVVKEIYAITF